LKSPRSGAVSKLQREAADLFGDHDLGELLEYSGPHMNIFNYFKKAQKYAIITM